MTNIKSMKLALDIISELNFLNDSTMIAITTRSSVPESYIFIKRYIINGHTIELYDMNLIGSKTYFADIRGLGQFQIM